MITQMGIPHGADFPLKSQQTEGSGQIKESKQSTFSVSITTLREDFVVEGFTGSFFLGCVQFFIW